MSIRMVALIPAAAALVASLSPAAAFGNAAPEPHFERRGLTCASPNTYSVGAMGNPVGFTAPVAAAVDPASQQAIDALGAAVASKASTAALVDEAQVPERTRRSCLAALGKLQSSGRCTRAPLYRLADGEVAQPWLCKGTLSYILFYTVAQGRITNIWEEDGDGPRIYAIPVR